MSVVLDVHVMPRKGESRTRKLHDAFLAAYVQSHPEAHVVEVDLAATHGSLPAIDEWDIQAKFEVAHGEGDLDEQAAERWDAVVRLTDQLHAANVIVVSAPMWNLTIPWHLKRWLDAVVQARLTFEYTQGRYRGLLGGRRGVILTTRDGRYSPGSPYAAWDFHMPYLRAILGFMGIDPIDEVVAEPMMADGLEAGQAALLEAIASARHLARSL